MYSTVLQSRTIMLHSNQPKWSPIQLLTRHYTAFHFICICVRVTSLTAVHFSLAGEQSELSLKCHMCD